MRGFHLKLCEHDDGMNLCEVMRLIMWPQMWTKGR